MSACTYLRLHDVVLWHGAPYRVALVNECRARLLPIRRRSVTVQPLTGTHAGRTIQFKAAAEEDALNISPNAELEIVGRWNPEVGCIRGHERPAPPAEPELHQASLL